MSFPEPTSGYIEDGRFYEVPVQRESVYVGGPPIEAIPVSRPTPPPPAAPPAKPPAWPKALFAVLAVLVVLGVAALVFIALRPADSNRTTNNSSAQISACREKVKQSLKAPATAQFSQEAVSRQPTGSFWEVNGVVDAQNGFGALIRNRYKCTVTGEGEALAVTLSDWS